MRDKKPELIKTNGRYILSVLAGLLCLLFSGFGITGHHGEADIDLVWSVIFPFIVALAWGSRYGLVAGIAGGALFPFLIWPGNGYVNIANFILLQFLYFLVGNLNPETSGYSLRRFIYRMILLFIVFIPTAAFTFLVLFNKLASLNPPFWSSESVQYFEPGLLSGFLIKDILNYFFLIMAAELLLHIPIVRKILYLKPKSFFSFNSKILITAIFISIVTGGSFVLLENVLDIAHRNQDINYYLFIFMMITACSIVVVRIIMSMMEKQILSETEFRKREQEFRIIFESLHAGIGIVDLTGKYRFFNKWWPQKLGYTDQEMETLRNTDITHPDDIAPTREYFNKLATKQINEYNLEKRFITKHGEMFWGQLYVSGIENSEGEIEYLAGITHDNNKKKKAEIALEKEKNFSQGVIDALPGIFYLYSYPELKLTLWNRNHETLLGFTEDELQDRHILQWHPENLHQAVLGAIEEVMQKGYNTMESPLLSKDGTSIPFLMTGIRYETENQLYLLGFGIDITEKKMAEDKLLSVQAKQEAMIANIADVIAIIDAEGINRYKSPNVEKWFGWKPNELEGRMTWENVHPEDVEGAMIFFQNILSQPDNSGTFECRYKTKQGNYKWIDVFAVNCLDSPEINGILINYKDISDRKKNEALKQEVALARKAAEFKQRFLANMSHEIRTPLTGVMGMAEILSQTSLTTTQKDYLNTLIQSGENLREIINLILDYSKIEAGKISLKNVVFSIEEIEKDSYNFFLSACNKPIEWEFSAAKNLVPFIIADKHRIYQIIRNLLSNAIKFTEKGVIKVAISLESESVVPTSETEPHSLKLRIEISDTGKGITEKSKKQLFEPFFQEDNENSRNTEGTGLGLSICKDLSKLMGGEIGVESTLGKGSKFWFTFLCQSAPIEKIIQKVDSHDYPEPINPMRILLVEDKLVNQKVIGLMLKKMNHNVSIADHGKKALEIYEPGQFDLILMDIQMPHMDGIEATARLRQAYESLPPIVGLSANAFEGDREKYMRLGLDEYLTKPFNKGKFIETIKKLGLS